MSRKQRILQTLQDSDQPLSTNQVAGEVDEHWKSVDNDLHELLEQGKVTKKRLSNRPKMIPSAAPQQRILPLNRA